MFFSRSVFCLLVGLFANNVAAITTTNAEAAYSTLMQWYNTSNGLWVPSTGWWNSANCLTVVADLAAIDPTVKSEASTIWQNTLTNAQAYNQHQQKVMGAAMLMTTVQGSTQSASTSGFLNGYYDDEGWWALAWIAVYDLTGNVQYLNTAVSIFNDMYSAYGTTPCGGIWWDKAHTYVNAIANELFLSVASHLANRVSGKKSYYVSIAKAQWAWFQHSGLINSEHLINDGLTTSTCKNNGETTWSCESSYVYPIYALKLTLHTDNQGVILGGLVELNKASPNSSYISTAQAIADAAISHLTDSNGILHDSCEPNCGSDGSQFKGVFARNLQILQKAAGKSGYATFLQTNADAIWQDDNQNGKLSVVWSGPYVSPANASTQSSAMDAIVGALAVA